MTFAEAFANNQGKLIDIEGHSVVPMLRIDVRPGDRVRVAWRRAIQKPVQGIRMKLQSGESIIYHQHLADVVLWRDTSPDEILVTYDLNGPAELRMWNCWRDDCGTMQAWVGNAGMRAERSDDRITVECNSRPEVTFADLKFDILIQRS